MKSTDFRTHEPKLKMDDHMAEPMCGRKEPEFGYSCTRRKGHAGRCEAGTRRGAVASWDYA